MTLEILTLGVVTIVFVYLCWQVFLSRQRNVFCMRIGCLPVTAIPQNRWLNGLDMALSFTSWMKDNTFLQQSTRLFDENGPTFSFRVMGRTVIWTRDPQNIKAMLATQADDFELAQRRIKAFRPMTGDGVFASNGEIWAHGRALLRPAFSRLQIADLSMYEKHFQNFIALLPSDGSAVDLQGPIHRLTMDIISETLFGESVNSLSSDDFGASGELSSAFDYGNEGVFMRMSSFSWWDAEFSRSCKIVHNYTDQFVEKALRFRDSVKDTGTQDVEDDSLLSKKPYVFLYELAKDTGDRKVLRDQVVSNLVAGRDTTAGLLSLAFWLLARHPLTVKALRAEIAQLYGLPPSYEQLKNMLYLRCVLDESKNGRGTLLRISKDR